MMSRVVARMAEEKKKGMAPIETPSKREGIATLFDLDVMSRTCGAKTPQQQTLKMLTKVRRE